MIPAMRGLLVVVTAIGVASCAARTWEVDAESPAAEMLSGTDQYDDNALLLDHDSPPPIGWGP